MNVLTNSTISLAKQLIEIKSTYDNKLGLDEVLDIALSKLDDFPIQIFEKKGIKSALVSNKPGCNNFKYLLNGHLDVVSGLDKQFKPFIKNGKLYGRGAQDMKTATAAMIEVFRFVAKKVDYALGLQIVTDEEIAGHCGTEYQIEQGITADFVIVGEPSDLQIINRTKGIIRANLIASGKSAHGAYPWEGENAVLRMSQFLSEFGMLLQSQNRADWTTTCDIPTIITSNKEFNKVAADCTVQLDIRYTPEDGAENIIKNIRNQLPRKFRLDVLSVAPAQYTNPKNTDILKLSAILKAENIIKGFQVLDMNGATDGKYFTKRGIPVVVFGIEGAGLHQNGEWVSIKSVEKYISILTEFLIEGI